MGGVSKAATSTKVKVKVSVSSLEECEPLIVGMALSFGRGGVCFAS